MPDLPNFLVGRILSDEGPRMAAGRATVEARLKAGIAVTPLGLGRPRVHRLLYQHGTGAAFGRNRTLRCPRYLEEAGGLCGIWLHRNSTCATWFCKHVRGAVGDRFWKSLNQLIGAVEWTLARWCVLELGVGAEALGRLFPSARDPNRPDPLEPGEIDGGVDPQRYREVWGAWHGREREFFAQCASLANALTWAEVTAIGGPDIRIFVRLTVEAYGALVSNELPDRLVVGSFRAAPIGQRVTRVVSYRSYDPLAVPKEVMGLLPYFDGRLTGEVLKRIKKERGIALGRALVRKLADFEILVPPAATL